MPTIRILFVEDDPVIRELVPRTFDDEKVKVTLARDGLEALELFEREAAPQRSGVPKAVSSHSDEGLTQGFDLVITDLQMPRMGGKELISLLRKKPFPPPIILCSAASLEKMKEIQADVFFKKPYNLNELRQMSLHLLKARGYSEGLWKRD